MSPAHADDLRALLVGGDRRSLAQAELALAEVERSPQRITDLVALTEDPDWLVSLRALDLLEKMVQLEPHLVQPHRAVFIGPLADHEAWEFHLQCVRAIPHLRWRREEWPRVLQILERDAQHRQKFVRTWAVDALARLADGDQALRPQVVLQIRALEGSTFPSLKARARQIRRRHPWLQQGA